MKILSPTLSRLTLILAWRHQVHYWLFSWRKWLTMWLALLSILCFPHQPRNVYCHSDLFKEENGWPSRPTWWTINTSWYLMKIVRKWADRFHQMFSGRHLSLLTWLIVRLVMSNSDILISRYSLSGYSYISRIWNTQGSGKVQWLWLLPLILCISAVFSSFFTVICCHFPTTLTIMT